MRVAADEVEAELAAAFVFLVDITILVRFTWGELLLPLIKRVIAALAALAE